MSYSKRLTILHHTIGKARQVGVYSDHQMLASRYRDDRLFFVPAPDDECKQRSLSSLENVILVHYRQPVPLKPGSILLLAHGELKDGDVLLVDSFRYDIHILARAADTHLGVNVTNQCNSRCLMCSQPPTQHPDDWLIDEAEAMIRHITFEPPLIVVSGGEPLLVGRRLFDLFKTARRNLPTTSLMVLSNGRLFGTSSGLLTMVHDMGGFPVSWAVPLYGHTPDLHDNIVSSPGAWVETVNGLLNLHEAGQRIQLRVVLTKSVVANLYELADFIATYLPFVREVAFMGVEPIGFARVNRSECDTSLRNSLGIIEDAFDRLRIAGVYAMFMNIPRCVLPERLWLNAFQSISDWKNVYPEECAACVEKPNCCGYFQSIKGAWISDIPMKIARTNESLEENITDGVGGRVSGVSIKR